MKRLVVPAFGIVVEGNTIRSDLLRDAGNSPEFRAAMDAVESMVLAHHQAGLDISSSTYLEGLETAVGACSDRFSDDCPNEQFVRRVASLTKWGEPDEHGEPFEPSDGLDDSHQCLTGLIDEAREIRQKG